MQIRNTAALEVIELGKRVFQIATMTKFFRVFIRLYENDNTVD